MSVSSVAMTWYSVKFENYTPDRKRERKRGERKKRYNYKDWCAKETQMQRAEYNNQRGTIYIY
jgi:hypothetical protein